MIRRFCEGAIGWQRPHGSARWILFGLPSAESLFLKIKERFARTFAR
jgi:hypothetical protein